VEFDDLQQSLAEQIRALRLEAGMSQEDLAFNAEIDRTYISQLERGIANPSLLILSKVADALNRDLSVMLSKRK
jgi:transcriptional regulator with XRE-family HTH domain